MTGQTSLPAPVARPGQGMTTTALMEALKGHYVKPEPLSSHSPGSPGVSDLLLEEVPAPGTNRRCDLLRVGMWGSRGHRIVVHELKVSRSDFQRELEDPAKAEAWWPYCHEFWIVTPPGLISPDDLPPGWGLMVPPTGGRARKFKVVKPAEVKTPQITPLLLVEIAKRVDNKRLKEIGELNTAHRTELESALRRQRQQQATQTMPHELRRRLELLGQVEEALGASLDTYGWTNGDGELGRVSGIELGRALADFVAGHVKLQHKERELARQTTRLRRVAERVLEALPDVPEEDGL